MKLLLDLHFCFIKCPDFYQTVLLYPRQEQMDGTKIGVGFSNFKYLEIKMIDYDMFKNLLSVSICSVCMFLYIWSSFCAGHKVYK